MPAFTAAIFATTPRSGMSDGHGLWAYALLFEGSRPCWEIHIQDKLFRFIPHPDHILEEGLSQLTMYITMPQQDWRYDPTNRPPLTLLEELGPEICKQIRDELAEDLKASGLHFRVITWPDVWMPNLKKQVANWRKAGIKIEANEFIPDGN